MAQNYPQVVVGNNTAYTGIKKSLTHHVHALFMTRRACSRSSFISVIFFLLCAVGAGAVAPLPVRAATCVPLPLDAVHWWKGDGNADDALGGNHGSLRNGAITAPGFVNEAFSLDGINDFVAVGSGVDFGDRVSVEGWVNLASVPLAETRVLYHDASKGEFQLLVKPDLRASLSVKLANGGWYEAIAAEPLTPDVWHHVAGVFDGASGALTVLVDGFPAGATATPALGLFRISGFPGALGVYAQGNYGGAYFHGMIDELTLYTRALAPEEIAAIYAAGAAGKCTADSPDVEYRSIVSDASWKASVAETPGWEALSFDDSSWGFSASPNTGDGCQEFPPFPGTSINDMWSPGQQRFAYFRTHVTLPSTENIFYARFITISDDDHDFYVNGQLAASEHTGTAGPYLTTDILPFLRAGDNVIAIKGDDAAGGCRGVGVKGTIIAHMQDEPPPPSNHAPILAYSQELGYATDGVNPDKGTADLTPLIFKAIYTDEDNDPPASLAVSINNGQGVDLANLAPDTGADVSAVLKDGNYTNGEQFTYASTFSKGQYQYHFEASDTEGSTRLPATGELDFVIDLQPVILIPGIAGSELFHNGEEIWMNVGKMTFDIGDDFLDVLAMNAQGQSVENIEVGDIILEKSILNIWVNLIEDLEGAGYVEDQTLFVFPYDWRGDNRMAAELLNDFINEKRNETTAPKVDLIAHSMGGLAAKQYIIQHGEAALDQLIFIGTPHYGAPKALKVLLYGDQFSIPVLDPDALMRIAGNMSSVYQLLPSQPYVEENETYFIDWADIDEDGITGKLDFSQTQALIGNFDLNTFLRDDAQTFHSSLDNWAPSPALHARTHNIVGCGVGTPGTFISFDDNGDKTVLLRTVSGDETVPLHSARKVNAGSVYYISGVTHARMPDNSLIRQLVRDILGDNQIDLQEDAYEDIRAGVGNCSFSATGHSVHSPVHLHAYDALGNHTGPNAQGGIDEEIPGSSYNVLGDDKFLVLPKGLQATVSMEGTGNGIFRYDIADITEEGEQGGVRFFDLPVTPQTKGEVVFDEDNIAGAILKLDATGDGQFEQTAPPSSVLDAEGVEDFVSPVISLTAPAPDAVFEHHQIAALHGSVTDDTAPLNAAISLDGTTASELDSPASPLAFAHSLPLPTVPLGAHTFSVSARDAAGNYAAAAASFTVIATRASFRGLLDWGLTHGWYPDPKVHKLIAKALDQLPPLPAEPRVLPSKLKKVAVAVIHGIIKLLDTAYQQRKITEEARNMLTGDLVYVREHL